MWACPSEKYCGTAYIYPNANSTVSEITFSSASSASSTSTGFTVDRICKYLISFPEGSGENDNVVLIPTVLTNVEAIFMTGL